MELLILFDLNRYDDEKANSPPLISESLKVTDILPASVSDLSFPGFAEIDAETVFLPGYSELYGGMCFRPASAVTLRPSDLTLADIELCTYFSGVVDLFGGFPEINMFATVKSCLIKNALLSKLSASRIFPTSSSSAFFDDVTFLVATACAPSRIDAEFLPSMKNTVCGLTPICIVVLCTEEFAPMIGAAFGVLLDVGIAKNERSTSSFLKPVLKSALVQTGVVSYGEP